MSRVDSNGSLTVKTGAAVQDRVAVKVKLSFDRSDKEL